VRPRRLAKSSFDHGVDHRPGPWGLAAIVLGPGSVYLANLVTFTLSLIMLYSLRATAASVKLDDG